MYEQQGFVEKGEKGLFTFYKEQESINGVRKKYGFTERRNVKTQNSNESSLGKYLKKESKNIYRSLNVNKKEELNNLINKSSEQPRLQTISAQNEIQEHQDITFRQMKKVVSLDFSYASPRKNGNYYKNYIQSKNRHNSNIKNYPMNHHSAVRPNYQYKKSRQNSKQLAEYQKFFHSKEEIMNRIDSSKKKLIKMNSIIGRCIEDQEKITPHERFKFQRQILDKHKIVQLSKSKEINRLFQKIKNEKILQKQIQQQQKKINGISNMKFKDILQLRSNKLQKSKFWTDLKHKNLQKQSKMIDLNHNILSLMRQGKRCQIYQIHQANLPKQASNKYK